MTNTKEKREAHHLEMGYSGENEAWKTATGI
jgi:hypothetical protein